MQMNYYILDHLISRFKNSPNVNRNIFLFTQIQLDEYIRRLEEAERNIGIAEAKIAERDQRIIEVERLLDCMGKVRQILHNKNQSILLADNKL